MLDFLTTLDPAEVSVLLGALTPALIAIVQQPRWSRRTRQYVAFALSGAVGLVVAVVAAPDGPLDFSLIVVAAVAAAEAFYQVVWQPTGAAYAIESETSPRHRASAG